MKASVSAKRCPQCGKVTGLHTSECGACGHRFWTRFAEPVERTEAFDAVMLPRPAAPAGAVAVRAGLSRLVLPGGDGGAGLELQPGAGPPLGGRPRLSDGLFGERSGVVPGGRAPRRPGGGFVRGGFVRADRDFHVALRCGPDGGGHGAPGSLVRPAPPASVLRLPNQSVRVSLFRDDLASDDYRVQAVALYHGNTLLHRHADDNEKTMRRQ